MKSIVVSTILGTASAVVMCSLLLLQGGCGYAPTGTLPSCGGVCPLIPLTDANGNNILDADGNIEFTGTWDGTIGTCATVAAARDGSTCTCHQLQMSTGGGVRVNAGATCN